VNQLFVWERQFYDGVLGRIFHKWKLGIFLSKLKVSAFGGLSLCLFLTGWDDV
jgi:hypothetical protein